MDVYDIPLEAFRSATKGVTWVPSGPNRISISTPPAGGFIQFGFARNPEMSHALIPDASFVLTVEHALPDVLAVIVEFAQVTEQGTDKSVVRCHFGVLPSLPTRLILPLSALNGERLFLARAPGVLQMVLRGSDSIPLGKINTIRIGTVASMMDRCFTICDAALTTQPEPLVISDPRIDALGQWRAKTWPSKTASVNALVEQLQSEIAAEATLPQGLESDRSRFGGWTNKSFGASGFFRTHYDGHRWWIVDPDGYAFLSTGFDCVQPGEATDVASMGQLTSWLPTQDGEFASAWQRGGRGFNYNIANLIRAFGSTYHEKWMEMTIRRMRRWGLNTIGAWSDPTLLRTAQIPYVVNLEQFPSTQETVFRDFPDVFSQDYQRASQAFAEQLERYRDDPWLIGYFLRNEPHWAFIDGLNLAEKLLRQSGCRASKDRLITFLQERYDYDIEALNQAWKTQFHTFSDLVQPLNDAMDWSRSASIDLTLFSAMMVDEYVRCPAEACRMVDPHHLNLGMRYAWISSPAVFAGSQYCDVYSINCYQNRPDPELIAAITERTGLPVILGEFHHGAVDAGLLSSGIRAVKTQEARGQAYRYFVEQGVALTSVVGMHYFQWNDQPTLGRFDGENYQVGALDVCHQPYKPFVEAIRQTQTVLYDVATGERTPYSTMPEEIPRTGF